MKSLIAVSSLAASLFLAPAMAFAQHPGPGHGHVRPHVSKPHVVAKKKTVVVKQRHWARGHVVPPAYRRHVVTDYRRHHLRAPARGQHWVVAESRYLLIDRATGRVVALR